VWFLFNHIYNCEYGIATGSDSGGPSTESYYIGNLIHNIHHTIAYDPKSGWSQAALTLVGGQKRYVVNNTIFDVDAGINSPSGGMLYIVNNVISNITEAKANDIVLETSAAANISTMHHNLLDGIAEKSA
jgi:hypothetical protein